MMDNGDHIDDAELAALADGQLDRDPHYKMRIEEAIARDPERAARARLFREQTVALRRAYDPIVLEPVPARLTAVFEHARPYGGARRALRAAAVMALAVSAGSVGWMAGKLEPPDPGSWAISAIADGGALVSTTNIRRGRTLSGMSDQQLPDWLAQEVRSDIRTPDLQSLGFRLFARQEVEVSGVRALRLDYMDRDGRIFNLFLRPRWDERDTGFQVMEQDGIAFASWMEGPLTTAITARLPREETVAIATAVRSALRGSGSDIEARSQEIRSIPIVPGPLLNDPAIPLTPDGPTKARPISDKAADMGHQLR